MSEEELRAELASRVKALQRRLANLASLGAGEKASHTCMCCSLPGLVCGGSALRTQAGCF